MPALSSSRSSWQCPHALHWNKSGRLHVIGWLNSCVSAQLKRCSVQSNGTTWSHCTVAYLFAASLGTGSGSLCCIMTEMQGDSWPIRGWLTPTFTSPLIYSLSNAQGMCISDAVKKWQCTGSRAHARKKKQRKHKINNQIFSKKLPVLPHFGSCRVKSVHVCDCVQNTAEWEQKWWSISIGRKGE